jgi:dTMP kinase
VFITFEGPEGAGKSTVLAMVAERLRARGHAVLSTREPGAGEVGKAIRDILLHGGDIHPHAELFLFLADRAQHVERIIRPFLESGHVRSSVSPQPDPSDTTVHRGEGEHRIVLCDRHADSTVVYQGHARGMDIEELRRLNWLATAGLVPDRTYLLDLPVEVGLGRLKDPDRLDREPIEFHRRVREGFRAEADREPERWRVLDATQTPEQLVEEILADLGTYGASLARE